MDDSPTIARREALFGLAAASATLLVNSHGVAQPSATRPHVSQTPPRALAGTHAPIPLPFNPRSLHGLSERLMTSHHDNNYAGAVHNLNGVEQQLAALAADAPGFLVAGLRERELTFRNSVTLHEAYFGNLGGDGRRAGAIDVALAHAYGTSAHWEEQFRAAGASLGGGSGWVVLALELQTGGLRSYAAQGHAQALATAVPLLVMDMYEHAYHIDFGATFAHYIDAFFNNVRWEEVNRRFEHAQHAVTALHG